ncbi:MAG: hypothetical protein PVF17_00845 [Ignavibacteria bacterium]|jgi:hypothetical protein
MNYNKKIITIEKVLELDPCYSEEELEELRKKNNLGKRASVLEILKSGLKADDILWLVLRPEFIEEKILHELSIIFATRALKRERKAGREPHPDSWKAIEVKKKWLAGKATDKELSESESAAISAADSAAWSAAYSAVYSAAWSAARSATYSSTYSVACSAARSAADSAYLASDSASWSASYSASNSSAYKKEQKWQIKQIISLLEKEAIK